MELDALFMELRKLGVSEVTFKLGNAVIEKKERKIKMVEPATDDKHSETKQVVKQPKPRYKPVPMTQDDIERVRSKCCPGFYTVTEMATAAGVGTFLITKLIDQSVPCFKHKHSGTKFYDVEDIYLRRLAYEEDILKHDGHRKGPVKFIADKLLALKK